MKNESLFFSQEEMDSYEHQRMYAGEELTFDITEDILIAMEDRGISKTQLAERLGKSKAYVSQILSGSRNMTLRTLSDICFAMGIKPVVEFTENEDEIISEQTISFASPESSHADWELSSDVWCQDQQSKEGFSANHNVLYRQDKRYWQKVAA